MAAPVGLAAAGACPAYPWPHDGSQRGHKVFMQSDCAACHSMLPYASLREAAPGGMEEAKAAEIVVLEEAQPAAAAARPLHGGARRPDLTHITKIKGGPRYNLYTAGSAIAAPRMLADGTAVCQELKRKMALPSPVWLQFLRPYMRTCQAARSTTQFRCDMPCCSLPAPLGSCLLICRNHIALVLDWIQ